jgi:hypothetical protein
MITNKILGELIELARIDHQSKMKLYEARNTGIALYGRVKKVVPMPAIFKGDPLLTYLRMTYTAVRGMLVRVEGL